MPHPAPPHLLLPPQTLPPQAGMPPQPQPQVPNQALFSAQQQGPISQGLSLPQGHRPLLLEEQPLLLQDLLDQERQEQQQQRQMQTMIRQRPTSETLPPSMGEHQEWHKDFD